MKFEDALKAMRDGKRVRRREWPSEHYIHAVDNSAVWHGGALYSGGSVLHEDWEIVREQFDFLEAVRRMQAGKKVRRDSWSIRAAFLRCEGDALRNDLRDTAALNGEDVLATDWTEVEP